MRLGVCFRFLWIKEGSSIKSEGCENVTIYLIDGKLLNEGACIKNYAHGGAAYRFFLIAA